MPELLRERLKRLRQEKELSRSALSRATVRVGFTGVPEATIVAYETRAGQVPSAEYLRALSDALGVAPDSFHEWPIAEAKAGGATPRPLSDVAQEAARLRGDTKPKPRVASRRKPKSDRAA